MLVYCCLRWELVTSKMSPPPHHRDAPLIYNYYRTRIRISSSTASPSSLAGIHRSSNYSTRNLHREETNPVFLRSSCDQFLSPCLFHCSVSKFRLRQVRHGHDRHHYHHPTSTTTSLLLTRRSANVFCPSIMITII